MAQDVSDYVPELWARESLKALEASSIFLRLVNRNYEADLQQFGDKINIPKPQTFVAAAVPTGGGWGGSGAESAITPTDLDTGTVSLTLDKWQHVTFRVRDSDLTMALKAAPGDPVISKVIRDHINPAAAALARAIDGTLFDLVDDVSITQEAGAAGTDLTPATIIEASRLLNVANVPPGPRNFLMSAKDQAALLNEEEFTSAQWDPQNADALRTARLGSKYGFDVFWSNLIGTATSTPTYSNVAFHPDAFALATRPLDTPDAGTIVARAADPDSGLSVRLEIGRNLLMKRTEVSLDVLWGVAILDAAKAVRVYS